MCESVAGTRERTLRETMKAMASIDDAAAMTISHSATFSPRRGRKHILRCGSDDLYSASGNRLSFSYS